jgi:hypothetical protein
MVGAIKRKVLASKPFDLSAAMDDSLARQKGLQARGNGVELGHEDLADDFGFGTVSAFGGGG